MTKDNTIEKLVTEISNNLEEDLDSVSEDANANAAESNSNSSPSILESLTPSNKQLVILTSIFASTIALYQYYYQEDNAQEVELADLPIIEDLTEQIGDVFSSSIDAITPDSFSMRESLGNVIEDGVGFLNQNIGEVASKAFNVALPIVMNGVSQRIFGNNRAMQTFVNSASVLIPKLEVSGVDAKKKNIKKGKAKKNITQMGRVGDRGGLENEIFVQIWNRALFGNIEELSYFLKEVKTKKDVYELLTSVDKANKTTPLFIASNQNKPESVKLILNRLSELLEQGVINNKDFRKIINQTIGPEYSSAVDTSANFGYGKCTQEIILQSSKLLEKGLIKEGDFLKILAGAKNINKVSTLHSLVVLQEESATEIMNIITSLVKSESLSVANFMKVFEHHNLQDHDKVLNIAANDAKMEFVKSVIINLIDLLDSNFIDQSDFSKIIYSHNKEFLPIIDNLVINGSWDILKLLQDRDIDLSLSKISDEFYNGIDKTSAIAAQALSKQYNKRLTFYNVKDGKITPQRIEELKLSDDPIIVDVKSENGKENRVLLSKELELNDQDEFLNAVDLQKSISFAQNNNIKKVVFNLADRRPHNISVKVTKDKDGQWNMSYHDPNPAKDESYNEILEGLCKDLGINNKVKRIKTIVTNFLESRSKIGGHCEQMAMITQGALILGNTAIKDIRDQKVSNLEAFEAFNQNLHPKMIEVMKDRLQEMVLDKKNKKPKTTIKAAKINKTPDSDREL